MLRIAHIADVHWRALSRHDEYREVFTAFAKKVKAQKVDHIFVGGDIWHTKTTGLSPEYIDQMVWWLELLADAAEVHLTLGNHDMNLVNLTRQDAITPIVEALKHPRVHLYKKSGVYEFAPGYCWGIFSLYDEENWDSVKPVPGKVNIACYHGPVWGALTETDWLVEEGITVEYFKEWDLCLLGDIHKQQFLAGRDVELEIDEAELADHPDAEVMG